MTLYRLQEQTDGVWWPIGTPEDAHVTRSSAERELADREKTSRYPLRIVPVRVRNIHQFAQRVA